MPNKQPQGAAQPPESATPLNQCDGCRAGAPINAFGNHRYSDGTLIACTRDAYAPSRPTEALVAEPVAWMQQSSQGEWITTSEHKLKHWPPGSAPAPQAKGETP